MVSKEQLEERFIYEDGELIFKDGPRKGKVSGYRRSNGYVTITFVCLGKKIRMLRHRAIFLLFKGFLPELVDHIDRNPYNDRIENLREADKSINAFNTLPRINNKTGVKGVFKIKNGKYEASVSHKGKKTYLGVFSEVGFAERVINDFRGNAESYST